MKRSVKRRRPGIERLEQRWLLAGDGIASGFSNWHNESHPSDVNGDGQVSPFDTLIVVNALKRFDPVSVEEVQADWYESNAEATELYGGHHPDVDGNGRVTSLDALRITTRRREHHG